MTYHVIGYNHPDKFPPGERERIGFVAYKPIVHLAEFTTEHEARERLWILRNGPVADLYESFAMLVEVA